MRMSEFTIDRGRTAPGTGPGPAARGVWSRTAIGGRFMFVRDFRARAHAQRPWTCGSARPFDVHRLEPPGPATVPGHLRACAHCGWAFARPSAHLQGARSGDCGGYLWGRAQRPAHTHARRPSARRPAVGRLPRDPPDSPSPGSPWPPSMCARAQVQRARAHCYCAQAGAHVYAHGGASVHATPPPPAGALVSPATSASRRRLPRGRARRRSSGRTHREGLKVGFAQVALLASLDARPPSISSPDARVRSRTAMPGRAVSGNAALLEDVAMVDLPTAPACGWWIMSTSPSAPGARSRWWNSGCGKTMLSRAILQLPPVKKGKTLRPGDVRRAGFAAAPAGEAA